MGTWLYIECADHNCQLRVVDAYGRHRPLQVDETDTDPGSGPVVRVDRYGFRWTLQDDGLWMSDVGTVRSDPHF